MYLCHITVFYADIYPMRQIITVFYSPPIIRPANALIGVVSRKLSTV